MRRSADLRPRGSGQVGAVSRASPEIPVPLPCLCLLARPIEAAAKRAGATPGSPWRPEVRDRVRVVAQQRQLVRPRAIQAVASRRPGGAASACAGRRRPRSRRSLRAACRRARPRPRARAISASTAAFSSSSESARCRLAPTKHGGHQRHRQHRHDAADRGHQLAAELGHRARCARRRSSVLEVEAALGGSSRASRPACRS